MLGDHYGEVDAVAEFLDGIGEWGVHIVPVLLDYNVDAKDFEPDSLFGPQTSIVSWCEKWKVIHVDVDCKTREGEKMHDGYYSVESFAEFLEQFIERNYKNNLALFLKEQADWESFDYDKFLEGQNINF